MSETSPRTSEGRFAPGQSGNPAGRPKGARNRGPTLRDVLNAGEELTMLRLMAEKALGGDTSCLKYCLDRLHARRRPVALDLLEGEEHDGESVHAAAMRAAADGEITPEEAAALARLIAARQPVMKAHLVERRLAIGDAIDAQCEAEEATEAEAATQSDDGVSFEAPLRGAPQDDAVFSADRKKERHPEAPPRSGGLEGRTMLLRGSHRSLSVRWMASRQPA
jgi:hypothetical protein